MAAAGVGQHLGADIAGVRALGRGMAILPAERNTAAREDSAHLAQQRRRRTDEQLAGEPLAAVAARGQITRQRDAIGAQPVHLPIAGDQPVPIRHPHAPPSTSRSGPTLRSGRGDYMFPAPII